MKKKVGIITYYYKNHNYGGLLQAYALQYKLSKLGFDAEQISFDEPRVGHNSNNAKAKLKKFAKRILYFSRDKTRTKMNETISSDINTRNHAFERFANDVIPHSSVYNVNTIKTAGSKYDVFITGSDQVWNPS